MMSLVLLTFLLGVAAGFYAGLILARLLHLPPDENETIILIVSRPANDDRPGYAVIETFLRARMLKHGIINRSRN